MVIAELFAALGLRLDSSSFQRGNSAIAALTTGIQRVATALLAVEGVRWFAGLVAGVEETAVSADHMAERLGISTQAVQELGYAASRSGASADEMQVSMQKLAKGLEEAKRTGTGPFVDALGKLKLSLNDPAIKSNDLDTMLMEIADRFSDMPQGAEKTALAMELFGRSGTTLIPLLNKGADGIKELREEAERLGVVIGDQDIKALEELRGEQRMLSAQWTGLKNTIAIGLVPAIRKAVGAISAWVGANREWLKAKIVAALTAIGTAVAWLGGILMRGIDVLGQVFDAIEHALPTIDVFKSAMVIAGLAIAAAWVAALGPVGLIAIAVVALGLVLQDLYTSVKYGDGLFADLWKTLTDGQPELGATGAAIVEIAKGFKDAVDVIQALIKWIDSLLDKVSGIKDFGATLRSAIPGMGDWKDTLLGPYAPIRHGYNAMVGSSDSTPDTPGPDLSGMDSVSQFYASQGMIAPEAANPRLGVGASTVTAPISIGSVEVHMSGDVSNPNDVANAVRAGVSSVFDEHVRNIQAASQGNKR